jgi:hypothetical protein
VPVRLKDLPPCGGFCSGPIEGLFLRKLSEVRYSHFLGFFLGAIPPEKSLTTFCLEYWSVDGRGGRST